MHPFASYTMRRRLLIWEAGCIEELFQGLRKQLKAY